MDDTVGAIFEPGAPSPSRRLTVLKHTLNNGFFSGVSLMPLLPFISDTTAHLGLLFSTFKAAEVKYVLPATITLYGAGKAASKALVLPAVKKHYPQLINRYISYFKTGAEMPKFYQSAFYHKMKDLCQQYDLKDQITTA